MTTTVDATTEVTAYLDQVRAQLDDLPEAERDDLLEDLEQHLREVSVEVDEPLAVRLGPPEAYAAELRQSAGLPARGATPDSAVAGLVQRLHRSGVLRVGQAAWNHPWAEAVRRFVPEMRPGWWVVRGVVLAGSWMVLFTSPRPSDLPVPPIAGSRLATVAFVGASVWASVNLGRRSSARTAAGSEPGGRIRLRRGVVLAAVAVNIVVLVAAFNAYNEVTSRMGGTYVYAERSPYLAHPDGSPITDIRPYGLDGKPLDGVLLYDQDGRPITNVRGPHTHATGPDGRVAENRFPVQPAPVVCTDWPDGSTRMCAGSAPMSTTPTQSPTTTAPTPSPTTTAPPAAVSPAP